jgi:hypothetical protein
MNEVTAVDETHSPLAFVVYRGVKVINGIEKK